jgi:predicted RNA binding protein YcfA (HicA-like mRNA interferase family)
LEALLLGKATNVRYSDVTRWLDRAGFQPPLSSAGSHRVWYHPSGARVQLVEKGKGELLPAYVKRAIKTILTVVRSEDGPSDAD